MDCETRLDIFRQNLLTKIAGGVEFAPFVFGEFQDQADAEWIVTMTLPWSPMLSAFTSGHQ
jgi:hypothetical protein